VAVFSSGTASFSWTFLPIVITKIFLVRELMIMSTAVFQFVSDIDKANNKTRALKTLLELDLTTNLRILSAIQLEGKNIGQDNSELAKVATHLRSESILAALLESKKKKSWWETEIKFLNEGIGSEKGDIENLEVETRSAREVLSSVYTSITTLQAISKLDTAICKKLRLKTRLNNLKHNLESLVNASNKHN
jgi:hypothetical protein